MEKKTILWIGIGVGCVILFLAGWVGIRLWQGTNGAEAAAEEFVDLLQAGEMEALELQCYAYNAEAVEYLQDEDGQVHVVTVTPQQMARRFGGAIAGEQPETGAEEETDLLQVLIPYSHAAASVGMVWGERTSMALIFTGPDIGGWLESLTEDELFSILSSGRECEAQIGAKLAAEEIPMRSVRMEIPMVKQDGKWRFRVTEEMEQVFYGGSYPVQ